MQKKTNLIIFLGWTYLLLFLPLSTLAYSLETLHLNIVNDTNYTTFYLQGFGATTLFDPDIYTEKLDLPPHISRKIALTSRDGLQLKTTLVLEDANSHRINITVLDDHIFLLGCLFSGLYYCEERPKKTVTITDDLIHFYWDRDENIEAKSRH